MRRQFAVLVFCMALGAAGEEDVVSGVVRDVSMRPDGRVAFEIHAASGRVSTALFNDASMIAPVDFEDALVEVCGTWENGGPGAGALLAEDIASVRTLESPPADPFALPAVDIAGGATPLAGHRMRVNGVVSEPGEGAAAPFTVYTASGAFVRVHPATHKTIPPRRGDVVDVAAFLTRKDGAIAAEGALVRILGRDLSRLPPYWTPRKIWALMGIVVASLLAACAIAMVLLRRFERARYDATRRERLRLSHDLHDNIQQLLAATMFRLDAAQNLFDFDSASAREQIGWAKKSVEGAQAGLRSVLWDLQEESEGPEALSALVRYAAGRLAHWQGRVSVETRGVETAASRPLGGRFLMIIQEAVGNALSKGGAANVRIRLFFRQHLVRLVVTDNGSGFKPGTEKGARDGHLGISSMSMRARELGGTFSVKSEPGRGTSVIVEVPV